MTIIYDQLASVLKTGGFGLNSYGADYVSALVLARATSVFAFFERIRDGALGA